MIQVEIIVSNIGNDHRIIIDGETVYKGDAIANNLHKPFEEWKDKILDQLFDYCNEDFSVSIDTTEENYNYLKSVMDRVPQCKEIVWDNRNNNSELELLKINIPAKIDLGETVIVDLLCEDELKQKLHFESDKPDVLQCVDGTLYALKPGMAEVTVREEGKIEAVWKSVIEVIEHFYINKLEVFSENYSELVGERYSLNVKYYPENAENADQIHYEIADTSIATVDNVGTVTLNNPGKTILTISAGNVIERYEINAELKVTGIRVKSRNVRLYEGEEIPFEVLVEPTCYSYQKLVISSSNTHVAEFVDGKICSYGAGNAEISFSSPNSELSITVEVVALSKEYLNARRAVSNQNYIEANRIYAALNMEYPEDWEADFFVRYTKILRNLHSNGIGFVTENIELLKADFDSVFQKIFLLKTDEEKNKAIKIILRSVEHLIRQCSSLSEAVYSGAYQNGSARTQQVGECVYCSQCCTICAFFAANTYEAYCIDYLKEPLKYAVMLWKLGVEIGINVSYRVEAIDKMEFQAVIDNHIRKIQKYDDGYNPKGIAGNAQVSNVVNRLLDMGWSL